MKSPLTGNEMRLVSLRDTISYRGVKCPYYRYYWECPDTKEQFTTTEMDEGHLNQIKDYWQSTRNPPKKENKTEKILRDQYNHYNSKLKELTKPKLDRRDRTETVVKLEAKVELLRKLKDKLK